MKLFKIILVNILLLSSIIFAEKPEKHEFKAGVMQEIYEEIGQAGSMSPITSSDLVGEWICSSYSIATVITHPAVDDVWQVDNEGLFSYFLGGTIIFQDDSDGTYSIQLSGQDPFYLMTSDENVICPYKIIGNMFYRQCTFILNGQSRLQWSIYEIEKLTPNKLIFRLLYGSSFASKVIITERSPVPQ